MPAFLIVSPLIISMKYFNSFSNGNEESYSIFFDIAVADFFLESSTFLPVTRIFIKGLLNFVLGKFSKGDIIYWRGHVAVCLNRSKLIHAYGPRKKVLTMDIKKTIELIKETAKLEIKKIIRV